MGGSGAGAVRCGGSSRSSWVGLVLGSARGSGS